MHRNIRPPAPQRGVATVLILLLVGLSLSAAALGTAHYIRSQQKQDIATHAQTQAQMKAWTGAELVRQYLQKLQTDNQLSAFYASWSSPLTQEQEQKQKQKQKQELELKLEGEGVTDAILANITAIDAAAGTVTARITGITAPASPAEARAVLEVVYATGTGSGTAPSQCAAPVRSSNVLRGDVSITGGQTSFTSGESYTDLAIDGGLTIQSASQAIISGCTKGDITLSGGGIDANATLSSQNGTIRITSMAQPTNATLWARAISIGNTGSASYNALKAGAYQSNVVAAGNVIVGTAYAGGRLLSATAGPSVPWTTGTVVPWQTGSLLVTLGDGGEYLVDMAQATIDPATGAVSGARAAAQKVNASGSAELPDSFTLRATAVAGGGIDLYTLSVQQIWGYDVTIQGWNGTYRQVWPAGNFKVVTGTITDLQGGGYLWATNAGSPTSNFPTIVNGGPIADRIYYGASKTQLATHAKVQSSVAGTSPGLPGAPFCDTRSDTFDAAAFRSSANYIFEFDTSGKPRLTIQHMKASNGTSIDRANIDLTAVDPAPATALGAMTLRRINGVDFLGCGNQSPSNPSSDALACLRSATPANGWRLNGITKFPPGIALFIGAVTIDGVDSSSQGTLYNTLLSTGGVTLTSSGHGPLVAPNFASPLTPVCDGSFYPANLCNKDTTPSSLVKWTDAEGQEHAGLPLANLAIGTNKQLSAKSWSITGNVLLGEGISIGGDTVNIAGSLTVGANVRSATTITQGGLKTNTTRLTQDQGYLPLPSGNCTPTATPHAITMKWSRYL
ncbi:hypothetical protein N5J23_17585 [Comamonas aquatica]|uniref:DUF342 domain-containing protein n=1 Tax=Comamonas aquatica TaxID=225991 RepID=A0AA42W6Y0_9BURK|nr:hypothetical protein [Comamonas aquatica]MDH1428943.1 hypothetical protein [Comamonas aquatica]MDH1607609.1 hypothetical protein [Comamonas aquatica]MDH1619347.1 hypothetical protein [Comamonas aquatica]MDH2007319.1 hypothetical protein [Comamonas aquatica]